MGRFAGNPAEYFCSPGLSAKTGFNCRIRVNKAVCSAEKPYFFSEMPSGDLIVIMGAGMAEGIKDFSGNESSPGGELKNRVLAAYRIASKTGLPVLSTGGSEGGRFREADAAAGLLLELGLPVKKIYKERNSLNTRENALFAAGFCIEKGFRHPILVSSALHLDRSVYSFREAGFKEISWMASDFRCSKAPFSYRALLPGNFLKTSDFFHEKLGSLFYRIYYN